MEERYTASAAVYDVVYGEMLEYPALTTRLVELIESRAPGATTLLEVACGTGLYLEQLQGRFDVTGFDLSAGMLAVARERLPDVPLHEGDMRTMTLAARFDVVACLGSSIAYLLTNDDLERTFRRFAEHLADGGVVVVEPWLQPDAWMDEHVGLEVFEGDGIKVCRMTSDARDGVHVTMRMHHLVGIPGRPVEHFVEAHPVRFFTIDEHLAAFAEAGLEAEFLPDDGGLGRGLYVAVRV